MGSDQTANNVLLTEQSEINHSRKKYSKVSKVSKCSTARVGGELWAGDKQEGVSRGQEEGGKP